MVFIETEERQALQAWSEEQSKAFPILADQELVYLDHAATAQKPQVVIDAVADFYSKHNANIHRGIYPLAIQADEMYDGARETVASFCAAESEETIFLENTTAAINLVARSWGQTHLGGGDQILLTIAEHHSNIVPWQLLAAEVGAELVWLDTDQEGKISLADLAAYLDAGPVKLVAVTHLSNVLSTINPLAEIIALAHEHGARVLVDGAQAVSQLPVNFADLDADFYAWGGHKTYGPTGIGVLHGKKELLREMPPVVGGGGMIASVSRDGASWASVPDKFEAGTPPIAEAVGLARALDYLSAIGIGQVRAHSEQLSQYLLDRLRAVDGISVYGPEAVTDRGGLASFALAGVHPHDIAEILARSGVAVRAGHHCAQPLMEYLGVAALTRASLSVFSGPDDVDRLIAGLEEARQIFAD